MKMTPRARLLAAIRGQDVDRVPWSPNLAYWWETQPEEIQDRGQFWFLKEIGADPLLRGFTLPFTCSDINGLGWYPDQYIHPIPNCDIHCKVKGDDWQTKYVTPVGTLTLLSRFSSVANTRFVVEHPIKEREDYKILSYIIEHIKIEPDYNQVQENIDIVDEDGLFVPVISPYLKTSFQALVEHFVGTEQLVYDLMDYPEEVEALLEIMSERAMDAVKIAVESPAEVFISWEDSSTTNLSPQLFSQYIAPEINRWGKVVRGAGKLLLHHACGHLRALLPIIAEEEVDAVESLSPPPTGNVEVWEAQKVLSPKIGIIGGIEPTQFLNLDLKNLHEYVEKLLDKANLNHFILANSDSCPPGVSIDKFRLVTDIVDKLEGCLDTP